MRVQKRGTLRVHNVPVPRGSYLVGPKPPALGARGPATVARQRPGVTPSTLVPI